MSASASAAAQGAAGPGGRVRRALQNAIRSAHRQLLLRELPGNIAIYFHELGPDQRDAFARSVTHFLDVGYETVTPGEFISGNGAKRLFVSFDDNFADWHRALPLLERLGVSATFYVNTLPFRGDCSDGEISAYFDRIAYRGAPAPLSRAELKEIHAAGHTIGCHSHSHRCLARLPPAHWDREIRDSKKRLEDIIGGTVRHFSYPYGMRRHFSQALRAYCAQAGFATIATGRPGLQHVWAYDPLNLHRTPWKFSASLEDNLTNLRIDARCFESLTGLSAIG